MSAISPDLAGSAGWVHSSVLDRRARERLLLAVGVLVPLILALAISIAMPKPSLINVGVLAALTLGVVAVVLLMCSTRYALSVGLLVLYLGLLDGPIKLETASEGASGIRNILVIAVSIGMIVRLLVIERQHVRLPPLSGWVLGFVAFVLIEALNPHTNGVLKIVAGYRQLLEWVPFFFFGYLLMRSRERFRKLFLVLGVIALANGVVGTIQSRESVAQLSSWGPGYGKRLSGEGLGDGYFVEGVEHPRPMALGPASGFGGGVGTLALPGLLTLLSVGGLRRRWPILLCCAGALLGVATATDRTAVIALAAALVSYGGFSFIAGLRVSRPLLGLILVGVLGIGAASLLVSLDGNEIFHRQEKLTGFVASLTGGGEEEGGTERAGDGKTRHLSQIPSDIVHAPFGFGLGRGGAVSGFGGSELVRFEEQKVSGGSTYNLLAIETGLPGLGLWIGLTISVLLLGVTRLRRIADPEMRAYLVAVLAAFVAFTILGLGGTSYVNFSGAFLWGAAGIVAYWLAGPGLRSMTAGRPAAP